MEIKIFSMALLLVSSVSHAGTINSISIFHTNTVTVVQDISLDANQHIEVFNMDTKNNATARLNKLIKQRLSPHKISDNYVAAYSKAFYEVLNGDNWDVIYNGLEQGGKAIEFAIRYKVKKTPAIVFNDNSVIYGVTSLKEAIQIYHQNGDDR